MQFFHLFAAGFAALAASSFTPLSRHSPALPMQSPISVMNIVSIVEDKAKVERETDLLTAFVNKVKENEPGVLVFELDLDRNKSQLLTYAIFKDQAAIKIHANSSYLAELLATEEKEQLKRAKTQIYFLELITQFIREPVNLDV